MFKFIIFLIVLYLYANLNTYDNSKNNKINKINKSNSIDLLINKVMLDEYLTKQEKNRLYNYIDYKISKNKNDTNEWIYIRNKLDI